MVDAPRASAGEEEELAAYFAFADDIGEKLEEIRSDLEVLSAGGKGIWSKAKRKQ
jgi:hypothetical protein